MRVHLITPLLFLLFPPPIVCSVEAAGSWVAQDMVAMAGNARAERTMGGVL